MLAKGTRVRISVAYFGGYAEGEVGTVTGEKHGFNTVELDSGLPAYNDHTTWLLADDELGVIPDEVKAAA
jgi:hypothetical protein